MSGPDPQFITSPQWSDLSSLLVSLWMIAGAGIAAAGSLFIAHGLIPSLAATRDLPRPELITKLRAPFYGAFVVFLGLVLVSVVIFISRLGVISDIFYRGAQ